MVYRRIKYHLVGLWSVVYVAAVQQMPKFKPQLATKLKKSNVLSRSCNGSQIIPQKIESVGFLIDIFTSYFAITLNSMMCANIPFYFGPESR